MMFVRNLSKWAKVKELCKVSSGIISGTASPYASSAVRGDKTKPLLNLHTVNQLLTADHNATDGLCTGRSERENTVYEHVRI